MAVVCNCPGWPQRSQQGSGWRHTSPRDCAAAWVPAASAGHVAATAAAAFPHLGSARALLRTLGGGTPPRRRDPPRRRGRRCVANAPSRLRTAGPSAERFSDAVCIDGLWTREEACRKTGSPVPCVSRRPPAPRPWAAAGPETPGWAGAPRELQGNRKFALRRKSGVSSLEKSDV